MKVRVFFFSLTILALMANCALVNSPKTAVRKFYKAIENNDSKAMAQVATPETVQLMAMFGTKVQGMVAANGKIIAMTEKINGDTAVVTVVFENGEKETLDLIKVNGKWKVSVSMDK
jgi:ketosteroid isomerase-like protein